MPANNSHVTACYDVNATGSIEDCIESTTYDRAYVLHDVLLGFTKKESVGKEDSFYNEDYTASLTGRQYSFHLPRKIGTIGNTDQLFLYLPPGHVCTIFLHDPHYFVYNTNPVALPTLMRKFDTRVAVSTFYRLALTEVNELNLLLIFLIFLPYLILSWWTSWTFHLIRATTILPTISMNVSERMSVAKWVLRSTLAQVPWSLRSDTSGGMSN